MKQIHEMLAIALVLAHAATAGAIEIRLRLTATATGPVVRLGDIATVSDGDDDELARWEETELFPAPISRSRLVRQSHIRDVLARSQPDQPFRFTGPSSVNILPPDRARPASLSQSEKPGASPARKRSSRSGPATVPQDGAVRPLVVVARRAIGRGERIVESDMGLEPASASAAVEHAFHRVADLLDREAAQPIPVGQPILPIHVRKAVLVKRRDRVAVRVLATGVEIHTVGRAIDDGGLDDLVMIETRDRGEQVPARVTGPREVVIEVGSAK